MLQNDRLALDYPLFDEDALVFTPVLSRRLLLHSKKTGRALQFTFDGFTSLGIWTPPHKQAPFVCLEPWCGMADEADAAGTMEQKPGVVRIAPGESYTCGYSADVQTVNKVLAQSLDKEGPYQSCQWQPWYGPSSFLYFTHKRLKTGYRCGVRTPA